MVKKVEALMFEQGPLHDLRFQLMNKFEQIGLKSGDILYRASNAIGPLGLPFSRIVARVTKSLYSHAAIVFIENNEINVLEINDEGTLQFRMIDWIDYCYSSHLAIYRLKDFNEEKEKKLFGEIKKILSEDPEYDFTFSDPNKFYCTESIIEIYKRAFGIQLIEGRYIKDVVPTWLYFVLRLGSFALSPFGTTLPFNEKLFYVGNKENGLISSSYTKEVFSI
jgi:hypothetical protein